MNYSRCAENASGFCGPLCVSATRYSGTKDVSVLPIVVTELKFRNVQRHILLTDLVECADNAALDDRPEAFNRIGMNGTDDIFVGFMPHKGTRKKIIPSPTVFALDSSRTDLPVEAGQEYRLDGWSVCGSIDFERCRKMCPESCQNELNAV
jgi:hypothetical protein